MTNAVIENNAVISIGKVKYKITGSQELVEVKSWPIGKKKSEVYHVGDGIFEEKTQAMLDIELAAQEKKDKITEIKDKLAEVIYNKGDNLTIEDLKNI